MRTAVISDLHLGAAGGEDLLRDESIRRVLFAEIGRAERIVLLGDVVELREVPLGVAVDASQRFFAELGEAVGEAEVIVVPGNHDHHLAGPLLDARSLERAGPLGLEQLADPSPGPAARLQQWLGAARLRIAYPGIWLREDVYATHGHYMDAHLTLPRAECVAAATLVRLAGPLPDPTPPAAYERVLRPLYGFFYGVAQARQARSSGGRRGGPSERAWQALAGNLDGVDRAQRLRLGAIRAGFPLAVRSLNALLRSQFQPDVSVEAIFAGGLVAAAELARRLGVDDVHVINGHTHRGGPGEGKAEWPLPGGGRLHNTGSWVFASVFHHPARPPSPYWPGTVTWVEGSEPPRRVQLLRDHSHAQMTEAVARAS